MTDEECKDEEQDERLLKAGWWIALLYSAPTLPIPILVGKLTHPEKMGVSEVLTLVDLFLLTAPLTVGVAVIALGHIREWSFFVWDSSSLARWSAPVIVLSVTTLLGAWLGYGEVKPVTVWDSTFPPARLVNILAGYLVAYGPFTFLSSVALGGYIAWVINAKILPAKQ